MRLAPGQIPSSAVGDGKIARVCEVPLPATKRAQELEAYRHEFRKKQHIMSSKHILDCEILRLVTQF